jgi:hypothetical protein
MRQRSESAIRIVSWNLGHQTRLAEIHPRFLDAVRTLAPDVLVLNEYVHDDKKRAPLIKGLAGNNFGLTCHLVSEQIMRPATAPGGKPLRNNQVLVASRFELRPGSLQGPSTTDNGGEANFLHVAIDYLSIEIVGIRVPAYGKRTVAPYWDAFLDLANGAVNRKICFVGDFNVDPDRNVHMGGKRFASLREHGWRIPSPEGVWSYQSGTRIDHALASPRFPAVSAKYIANQGGFILGGTSFEAISDHAALVIDMTTSPAVH